MRVPHGPLSGIRGSCSYAVASAVAFVFVVESYNSIQECAVLVDDLVVGTLIAASSRLAPRVV